MFNIFIHNKCYTVTRRTSLFRTIALISFKRLRGMRLNNYSLRHNEHCDKINRVFDVESKIIECSIYLEEYASIFLQNRTALILKCFTSFVDCIFFIIKIAPFKQSTHHNILHNLYENHLLFVRNVLIHFRKPYDILTQFFLKQA